MEKQIGKEFKDEKQREAYLRDNCEKVENVGYMKQFTPDELQERKERLAVLSIEIDDIETELKSAIKGFKTSLKTLKEEKKEVVIDVKRKAEYVTEPCYKFVDIDSRLVGFYNSEGDLIIQRSAMADEAQPSLFVGLKTGTNN